VVKTVDGDEFEFFPAGSPLLLRGEKGALRWKTESGSINGAFATGNTQLLFGPLSIRPLADSSIRAGVPTGKSEIHLRSKLMGCEAEIPGAFNVVLSNGASPKKGSYIEVIVGLEVSGYKVASVIEGGEPPLRLKGLKGGPTVTLFHGAEAFVQDGKVVSVKGKFEADGPVKWEEPAVTPEPAPETPEKPPTETAEPPAEPPGGAGEEEPPGEPPAPETPGEAGPETPDAEPPGSPSSEETESPPPAETPESPPAEEPPAEVESKPPSEPEASPPAEPPEEGEPASEDPPPAETPEEAPPPVEPPGEATPPAEPPGEAPPPEITDEPIQPPDESPDIQPYNPPEEDKGSEPEEEAPYSGPVVWVLRGKVALLRDGKAFPLPKGRNEVKSGDVIRVGPRAKARVETPGGVTFTLGENSEFLVE
jgi:hypothetical protein